MNNESVPCLKTRIYRHDNVIRMYGVSADASPLAIVMELCVNGTVLSYLRNNETPSDTKVVSA